MRMMLKDGKRKVLTLSYDDGVKQDVRLIEILDKYGIKCTFNLNSGIYNRDLSETRRMDREGCIKTFKNSGHEVAIHGYNHPFYTNLEDQEIIYETVEDRRNLEKDFGVIVRGMAYPFGPSNANIHDVLKKCGIVYARTTRSTKCCGFPENWLALDPTCHHNDPDLMKLAKNFADNKNRYNNSEMFYLWGHSYEFDDHDNWNVIEEFAEYIGGRDDIWYATNIEVYDYVQAYKQLQVSYDQKIIHNPTAIDVWFDIYDDICCVKAGETLIR